MNIKCLHKNLHHLPGSGKSEKRRFRPDGKQIGEGSQGRKALPAAHEKVVFKRDHFVNNRKP
jgi:hypothetical protein